MADIIASLDPRAFLGLGEKRRAAVELGDGIIGEHSANRLANELHPKTQYLFVKEIIKLTEDCNTYVLAPDGDRGTKRLAYFSAGQYLSVRIEIGGKTYSRPYSLCSSPREALDGSYSITVKAVEGGLVSNYILRSWSVGTSVEASQPLGNFTYEPLRDAGRIIGVAGGSGITPFVSLAKAIADGDEDCSLTLISGFRDRSCVLFYDELIEISKSCDRVRAVFVLSEDFADGFEHGLITADLIGKYANDAEYSIFVCGPQALHSFINNEAKKLGIEEKYLRHELPGEAFLNEGEDRSITVTLIRNGEVIKAVGAANKSILRILEEGGAAPCAGCRSGECGFCRARLVLGEVFIPKETDRRRLADEKHGYIHPCCTYPKGDITIEINE